MLPFHLLPKSWQSNLAKQRIEPVRSGSGGAFVCRVHGTSGPARFLKIAEGECVDDLIQEIRRTMWLGAQHINVPTVLQTMIGAEVAAMITSPIGGQSVEDWRGLPTIAINNIAKALAHLHTLPTTSCPYDEDIRVRLARAEADISRGRVNPDSFDERNEGLSAQELLERLLRVQAGIVEDIVV